MLSEINGFDSTPPVTHTLPIDGRFCPLYNNLEPDHLGSSHLSFFRSTARPPHRRIGFFVTHSSLSRLSSSVFHVRLPALKLTIPLSKHLKGTRRHPFVLLHVLIGYSVFSPIPSFG